MLAASASPVGSGERMSRLASRRGTPENGELAGRISGLEGTDLLHEKGMPHVDDAPTRFLDMDPYAALASVYFATSCSLMLGFLSRYDSVIDLSDSVERESHTF